MSGSANIKPGATTGAKAIGGCVKPFKRIRRHPLIASAVFLIQLVLCPLAQSQRHPAAKELAGTSYRAGDYYAAFQLNDIELQISDAELQKMHDALPERIYVPATFRYKDLTLENVGVRFKGNSSSNPRQAHKRSFLIKFSEFEKKQRFLGLERIALDNGVQFGSLFSEPLVTEVLRDLKIPASRCNHARLFLSGTFHGVYSNVERIDTTFVANRFPDGKGPLYKCDLGGPGANLTMVPGEIRSQKQHRAFEPKSKAAQKNAGDVFAFIALIQETPEPEFAATMNESFAMDNFLKTMAVMLYAGAFDQLTGWNPHNYYLYRDTTDSRWHYLPWDLDVGFADKAFGKIPVIDGWNAAWPIPGGPPRPLIERIVDDPVLLKRYRGFADEILEKCFRPDVLIPKLDRLYELIRNDLQKDPFPSRRATVPADRNYDDIIASMKAFIRRRYATARAQLDNPGKRPEVRRPQPGGPNHEPRPGMPSKDAPSELRVVGVSPRGVKLQWMDNATGEAGHIVQRASGNKGDRFRNAIGKPGQNETEAVDPNVTAGQTYRYRVYALKPTPDGPEGTGVSNVVEVEVPMK